MHLYLIDCSAKIQPWRWRRMKSKPRGGGGTRVSCRGIGIGFIDRRIYLMMKRTRRLATLKMMLRLTIEHVGQRPNTGFPSAIAAVKMLEDLGIVTEVTGQTK